MLLQWPKLVTLGLEATAGEGQWISRENVILVGLSICSHPLPILPDYALRSLWLEGKVSDALLMKTREGCKNKKLILPVLKAAGGPRPVLQTLTNLFLTPVCIQILSWSLYAIHLKRLGPTDLEDHLHALLLLPEYC